MIARPRSFLTNSMPIWLLHGPSAAGQSNSLESQGVRYCSSPGSLKITLQSTSALEALGNRGRILHSAFIKAKQVLLSCWRLYTTVLYAAALYSAHMHISQDHRIGEAYNLWPHQEEWNKKIKKGISRLALYLGITRFRTTPPYTWLWKLPISMVQWNTR